MSEDKSYVGDIGTRVRTYLNADITLYTGLTYYVKKPISETGTEIVDWDCEVQSEGSGIVFYDVESGDFDYHGEYKIQTLVEYQNGDRFKSYTRSFIIYDPFE